MRRWDIDERRTGIADGTAMDPQVESLLAGMRRDGWVTEEPEVHLLPHLKKACGETGWRIVRERLVDDGVYEVRRWRPTRTCQVSRCTVPLSVFSRRSPSRSSSSGRASPGSSTASPGCSTATRPGTRVTGTWFA